jgi:hypothetical protein
MKIVFIKLFSGTVLLFLGNKEAVPLLFVLFHLGSNKG